MLNFIKSLFCNHTWEKIDEQSFVTSYSTGQHIRFFNRKRVLVFCSKCGKLKKVTL